MLEIERRTTGQPLSEPIIFALTLTQTIWLLLVKSLNVASEISFPPASSSSVNSSSGTSSVTSSSVTSSISSSISSSVSPSSSSSQQKDTTIDHIEIVADSFNSKIVLNSTVDYDNIQIKSYNKAGELLGAAITVGKNASMFSYSPIDTSKEVGDAIFTLVFTYSGVHYEATIHYSVKATYNITVASVKIVAGTVSAKYYLGDTVDYGSISIKLLNSDDFVLETIQATDSRVTHSTIDLSSDSGKTGSFTFSVTFTSGSLSLGDQVSYSVYYAEQKNTPTGWVANDKYTSYQTAKNSTSSVKDGSTSAFMEKAEYHIGNYNSVNLMPKISAAKSDGTPVTYSRLYDTTVKLLDASDNQLTLDDYFEPADIAQLTTSGEVNFKNTVTGKFKLVYTYGASSDRTKFPDITYELTVVSGYNINSVSDLFILNNANKDEEESGVKVDLDSYRAEHNFPTDEAGKYLTFDSGVFQSDLTITKDNLPSAFIWSKDDGAISDVVGSYKDGSYLVHFVPTSAHKSLNVYGNYHKLTVSSDVPKIVTPVGDKGGQAKASGDTHVDSHAAIFSNYMWKEKAEANGLGNMYNPDSGLNVYDLFAVGNQGVTSDDLSHEGGLIFMKNFFGKSTIHNCITNKFFLSAINGSNDFNISSSKTAVSFAPHMEIEKVRASDTYSCSLFNYNVGTIDVVDSELRNAGGPLIFNQGHDYTNDEVSAGLTKDKWLPNDINIDGATVMDNMVSGSGGWFAIYSSSTAMGTLMNLNPLFQAKGKTFVKKDGTVNKMNLIGLNMVRSASIGAASAAFCGGIYISSQPVVDYFSGKDQLEAGIANAANDSGAAYQQSLYSTDYGLMYMLKNGATTTFFKTMNGSASNYAAVYATNPSDMSTYSLVNPKMMLTQQGADAAVSDDFYTKGYLTIYTMGSDLGGDPSDITKYSGYLGSNAYGIITYLDDYSA